MRVVLFFGCLNSLIMAAVPDREVFDAISILQIGLRFCDNIDATIRFCRQYGLLATRMDCENCGRECNQGEYTRAVDGLIWRCPRKHFRRKFSIRKGSFFEGSRLQLWQIIGLVYNWCRSAGSSRGMS